MKKLSKRTLYLLLGTCLAIVLAVGIWYYYAHIKADEIIDGYINKVCTKGVILPKSDSSIAKAALKKYSCGADYPTTSSTAFAVDLDTYASTWSNKSLVEPKSNNQVTASSATTADKALDFDGNNDYVDLGNLTELNSVTKFSMSTWVKQDATTAMNILFRIYAPGQDDMKIETIGPNLSVHVSDGNGYGFLLNYTDFMTLGKWHHIAVVFDGTQKTDATKLKLYIDTKLMTLTYPEAILGSIGDLSTAPAYIGNTSNSFDGSIKDFRIYSSAVAASDVTTIYNGGTYTTNMVHQYKLTEGTGTVATDTGSNVKHGKISGATWIASDDTSIFDAGGTGATDDGTGDGTGSTSSTCFSLNTDSNYEAQRLELKQKLPQIISEIKKVYGEPYNKNRVLVAYLPDWQSKPDLNQYGVNFVADLYREDINTIFLSEAAFDGNGKLRLDQFIHELTHAFNDGNIPVDSYEEGLVGATTTIVMKKFDPAYPSTFADTSFRTILASTAGLVRTFDGGELVIDRYAASAKFFYDQLQKSPNFIKDYRARLKASKWYPKISPDPYLFMQKQVVAGACDELTRHYSEFEGFLHDMENLLVPTLGNVKGPKNSNALGLLNRYPIINLMPESKVYLEMKKNSNDPSQLGFISSYKINNIQNLIPVFYRSIHPTGNLPKRLDKTGLEGIFTAVGGKQLTSLGDAANFLDQPIDSAKIELYNGRLNISTQYLTVKNNSYNFKLNEIIAKTKYPKFTGTLKFVVTTSKGALSGKTARKCLSAGIGNYCFSNGLDIRPISVSSPSVSNTLTVKDGKVTNVKVLDANSTVLDKKQAVPGKQSQ